MRHTLFNLFLRSFICCVLMYFAWRQYQAIGLAFSSVLAGLALSHPLMQLVSDLKNSLKRAAYASLQGRCYAFQNVLMDITEGKRDQRWLRVADVRKVLEGFPKDAVLLQRYPIACKHDKRIADLRIEANALVDYLQSSTKQNAHQFRHWLERKVIFPAKNTQDTSQKQPR